MTVGKNEFSPRVLVVEDDWAVRECLVFALVDEGFQVTSAKDGVHALEMLSGQAFDIILSDNRMPRMSGLTLYESVRRIYGPVPFVLFSAHIAEADLPEDIVFVPKPVPPTQIIQTIRGILAEGISGSGGHAD